MQNVPNQPKQKKFKLSPNAVMTYLLVAVLVTMGVSFSKYSTIEENPDVARVAKFDVSIAISETELVINNIDSDDDIQITYFTVENKSEVSVKYDKLKIVLPDKLQKGVNVVLAKRNDNKIYEEMPLEECVDNSVFIFRVNDSLGTDETNKQTKYKFTVEYDEFTVEYDESLAYASQLFEGITVSLDAVQIN